MVDCAKLEGATKTAASAALAAKIRMFLARIVFAPLVGSHEAVRRDGARTCPATREGNRRSSRISGARNIESGVSCSRHCSAKRRRAQCRRGLLVRTALGLISGLLLAGCAARDPVVSMSEIGPAGNWQIEKTTDRVPGQPISNAMMMSLASHSSQPFPHKSMLQLQCFKSDPIVRVLFDTKIGSTRNSEVGYRFDDKLGRETATVRFVDDDKSFVIEDPTELASFIPELNRSHVLYFRIRSFTSGRTGVEFKLDGADAAVAAAYASCPLKPPQPAPAKRKRR